MFFLPRAAMRSLLSLSLCMATASGFMIRSRCSYSIGTNTIPSNSVVTMMQHQAEQGGRIKSSPTTPTTTMPPSISLGRKSFIQGVVASVPLALIPLIAGPGKALASNEEVEKFVASKNSQGWVEPEVTEKGFMDISIGGKPVGRLVISLYGSVVPNTVKNFNALLTGKNGPGVSYQGSEAYRVLDNLNIQMGAIGSRSGKSGVSSTGENIPQENFDIPHMKKGLLSMVRNQDAQGDSRFFINIQDDAGWADNRYVAFGRVSEGMDVVHAIELIKVEGGSNKPKEKVVIEQCGVL